MRAWFNALARHETLARGREAVEKLLQREGKTAVKLDDLAAQLGFQAADDLFEVVGKDEFSLRHIETLLRPAEPPPTPDEVCSLKRRAPAASGAKGGVLVVGVESLHDAAGACCRPAPPDAIGGFVTRGKGVAHPPRRLQQLPRDGGALAGARDRGRVGRAATGEAGSVPGRRHASRRPTARACCATSPKCSPRRR